MSTPDFEVIEARTKDEIEACLQIRDEVDTVEQGTSLSTVNERMPEGRICLLLNTLQTEEDGNVLRTPVGTVDLDPAIGQAGRYILLQGALDNGLKAKLEEAVAKWQAQLSPKPPPELNTKGHIRYFLRHLRHLPSAAEDHDANRITIAYFCLSGLDVLGALFSETTPEQRNGWADWVWSLQAPEGGFRGSPATTISTTNPSAYDPPHLPSTYTAILTLALLRSDFSSLNRAGLKSFLQSCQTTEGSFSPVPLSSQRLPHFQCDARMSYVAVAVSSMLHDFSGIDVDIARRHVQSCQSWDGAFGARPGLESQGGGTTYCCVASLCMLPSSDLNDCRAGASRWLLQRQIGGFQGRPGKLEDVCYSFWCGGALQILIHSGQMESSPNVSFLLDSQFSVGGFAKDPEAFPDPFHSYLAIAAMAFSPEAESLGLQPLDVCWNVTQSTSAWIRQMLSDNAT